ncbi:MAG: biotin transporter BioY [Spirochaetales bacterium]
MSMDKNHSDPTLKPSRPGSALNSLQRTVLVALGAAATAVGAFIAIPLPLSPVPLVLQNFFILLLALVLGPRLSTTSVALYLFLGALGLPVFAGGKGGFAHFFGPTGGYLAGFLLAAWVTGVLSVRRSRPRSEQGKTRIRFQDAAAAAAGTIAVYLLGIPWLAYKLGFDWQKAFLLGCLPFLPGDILKATAAAALAPQVRHLLRKEFLPHTVDTGENPDAPLDDSRSESL